MLSIYDYIDPGLYLRDVYTEKKQKNARFSIRSWAKQMDMKYHNPLHEMVKGKRKVSKSYIPQFIKALSLDVHEGNYFDTLVCLQRAKLPQEKEIYLERLRFLSPKPKLAMLEVESFHSLKDPLHVIITELSGLKGFKTDAKWIQNKLGFKKSIQEINEAIERLITLGLMERDIHGEITKTQNHIYSKSDVLDYGLQEYHQNVMKLASKAIEKQKPEDREYNAYCINIDKSRLPEIKKSIRKFMNDFAFEFEAKAQSAQNTYQLNTQFFNLTDKIDD